MEKLSPPWHIFIRKGGIEMAALWWATTIGFVICLGILCGTWLHFLRRGLNTEDSTRIDPLKDDSKD